MPKFLVKGRLKPARKAELAARLQDGTLAQGSPFQDELLQALRGGHASGDEVYFLIESRSGALTRERPVLEGYFDVERVLPVREVPEGDMDAVEGLDPLPDWAGVDR